MTFFGVIYNLCCLKPILFAMILYGLLLKKKYVVYKTLRKWQLTPVLLSGKFHAQRSLAGTDHAVAKSWT